MDLRQSANTFRTIDISLLTEQMRAKSLPAQGEDGEPCDPYRLERCDERSIIAAWMRLNNSH